MAAALIAGLLITVSAVMTLARRLRGRTGLDRELIQLIKKEGK